MDTESRLALANQITIYMRCFFFFTLGLVAYLSNIPPYQILKFFLISYGINISINLIFMAFLGWMYSSESVKHITNDLENELDDRLKELYKKDRENAKSFKYQAIKVFTPSIFIHYLIFIYLWITQ